MKHPPEYYADKPNLVRLAREISSCKHPGKVLNALDIILSDYAQGQQAQDPIPEGQTNNERFNALLNSCKNPRDVYNALSAFAGNGKEAALALAEEIINECAQVGHSGSK